MLLLKYFMLVHSVKFYFLLLLPTLLLCGCDMQRNETRHPLFIKAKKLEQQGNYSAAVIYYQRFLNVYPTSPAAHKALATIYDEDLLQYIPAIYHYDCYLKYAQNATDRADMKKWRDATQRKYYLKTRDQYNDQNDVQVLKRKNNILKKKLLKSSSQRTTLINYIKKMKRDIAITRTTVEQYKARAIGLEIKLETLKRDRNKLKEQLTQTRSELADARATNLKLTGADNDTEHEGKTVLADNDGDDEQNDEHSTTTEAATDAKPAPQVDESKQAPKTVLADNPTPEKESAKSITAQSYTVKRGDTLSSISRKFYGAAKYYRHIMNANTRILKSANQLQQGQQLLIPPLDNNP